jgi:hypothetical protein
MKTFQKIVTFGCIVLTVNTISAQFGNNGMGNPNRMNQMNNGMGMPNQNNQSAPKEVPVAVTVGKIMENLKTELTLDELQVIAISNIMTESVKKSEVLRKKEMPQEDKIKEMQAESEATDIKIMYLLYKNQKEKYSELVKERKKRFEAFSGK